MRLLYKTKDFLHDVKGILKDHHQHKYISYSAALGNWIKNRDINYEIYTLETVKKFVTSDTVFVLGSGPSLNLLTKEQIGLISKHNSFGINFSFLKEELVPTYHLMSYERNKSDQQDIMDRLIPRRKLYQEVVFFLSHKALLRLAHPRTIPSFFPINPKCCLHVLPKSINLEKIRPFSDEDFDKTLFYRGTITLVLDLVLGLGYKNIVLLGVDIDKPKHYYDDMAEMKYFVEKLNKYREENAFGEKREAMVPKGNKYHSIDVYFFALKDYLERRRGVKLFVGYKDNMLYPKLPAYFE